MNEQVAKKKAPAFTGHTLQRRNDHYVVRWQEGGYRHARYFVEHPDAQAFLDYVQEYDPNGYAASVA